MVYLFLCLVRIKLFAKSEDLEIYVLFMNEEEKFQDAKWCTYLSPKEKNKDFTVTLVRELRLKNQNFIF